MTDQSGHAGDAGRLSREPVRVLIDTNVILDWLLDRSPWADEAHPLWHAQSAGLIVGYAPASAVTDLFYIARRARNLASAFAAVDRALASLEGHFGGSLALAGSPCARRE